MRPALMHQALMRPVVLATALALCVCAFQEVPCQSQFLKKLGQELLQGQSGSQGGGAQGMPGMTQQGTPAGSTNLPAGQYMMTNMQTGQGFYIMVNGNGQMFATVPNNQQMPANTNMMLAPQGAVPQQQVPQQQQGGVGGFFKGTLNNMLQNQLSPGAQQGVPVQQQY